MSNHAVTVSARQPNGQLLEDRPWVEISVDALGAAAPWRTFHWRKGQRHYAGTYWSSTTRSHVIYESRLELARLLCADFEPSVHGIVAQPFLLKALVDGQVRKHVPDYLLITDCGPVVVDVKPRWRWSTPVVSLTFAWTRQAVEGRGWSYEVWDAPPPEELENIRFLAGYRRPWLFDPSLLDELHRVSLDGVPLRLAPSRLPNRPEPQVRAAVHHLLWSHDLFTDLTAPLCPSSLLRTTS
ncbi:MULTISPECIES: TnsA-like heteromeric transposase endonuclease subunit [unclassified Streptomyces]|uniref:TnsA-like heteromeric transposase endonuclease subunit n=1 Tax=unclassified Streptomyces TaxID=2593676 RepID=UPI00342D7F4E